MKTDSLSSSPARRRLRLIASGTLASAAFAITAVPGLATAASPAGKLSSAASVRKAAHRDPNTGSRSAAARRALRLG